MKTIATFIAIAFVIALQNGCAARATVGNHDQHGAAIATRTSGTHEGVHAKVY
jgi:hypothetical protein